jgi:GTPase KRas protein
MSEIKLAVVGGGGVGKSAVTVQYVQCKYLEVYDPTIQDSYTKQTKVDGNVEYLEILDTAGQEEYSALRDAYMRNCQGFLVVYDITKKKSLFELEDYIQSIQRAKEADKVPVVIIGNKCDMANEREVTDNMLNDFLKKFWEIPHLETSAKLRTNIDEAFELLIRQVKLGKSGKPTTTTKPTGHGTKKPCLIWFYPFLPNRVRLRVR